MKLGTLCYLEQNGKILMLHRVKKENDIHQGLWVGLGGKVERGESPEDCIIREFYEESGLTVLHPKLRGVLTFPGFEKDEDWYVFLFSATEYSGEVIDSNEGILQWVSKEQLKELPMHTGDYLFLQWMERYRFFSAKFYYDGEDLTKYEVFPHVKLEDAT